MSLPYIKSNNNDLVVYVKGRPYNVPSDHEQYEAIVEAISDGDSKGFLKLFDKATVLKETLQRAVPQGSVEVRGSNVYYDGFVVENVLADRILEHARNSLPIEGLKKFLANLMENPSRRAVQELYRFLEHKGLPVTEDGCFYAYKAVTSDFLDKYSRTIDNSPGKVVEIERNKVDDEYTRDCSYGLHVGTMEYVRGFGVGSDKILLVKVNPKDCVTVPQYDSTKMRVCRYEVIQEFDRGALDKPLYSASGPTPVEETTDYWDEEDDDLENENYDEDEQCLECGDVWCSGECLDEEDVCLDPYCEICNLQDSSADIEETSKNEYIEARVKTLDEYFNRDTAVTEAAKRGLIATKEVGRKMGKHAVCLLLAQDDYNNL